MKAQVFRRVIDNLEITAGHGLLQKMHGHPTTDMLNDFYEFTMKTHLFLDKRFILLVCVKHI
jgi:hypothetical protein